MPGTNPGLLRGLLQRRHSPHPRRPLLFLPRSGFGRAQGRPAARSRGSRQGGSQRRGDSHRSGQARPERHHPPAHQPGSRRGDASAKVEPQGHQGRNCPHPPVDRGRCEVGAPLGLHPAGSIRPSSGPRSCLAPQRDRSLHPGGPQRSRTETIPACRSGPTAPPRDLGPHRPAAHHCGARLLSPRSI